MTRKQRVTRVVYGVYVVLVAAFVVSNIYQVGNALFGPSAVRRDDPSKAPKVGFACQEQIKEQMSAIELARIEATMDSDSETAKARYAESRDAKKSADLERACKDDPNGLDALAALARFDRVAGDNSVRSAEELSRVRLSTQSFISGHPR